VEKCASICGAKSSRPERHGFENYDQNVADVN
jgi:hypothetical protein